MSRLSLVGLLLITAASACTPDDASNEGAGGTSLAMGGRTAATGGNEARGGADNGASRGGSSSSAGAESAGGNIAANSGGNGTNPSGGAATSSGGTQGNGTSGGKSALGGSGGKANAGAAGSDVGSGSGGKKSTPIAVKDLPIIKEMPDPLTMKDGTKVTTEEQWKARRQEMIQILEDYEYGHMPPPPANVKASTVTASKRVTVSSGLEADYRMLHLTFGPDDKLGFDLGIFTPVKGVTAPFPILVSLTFNSNEKSISDATAALSRGYAVATVPYQQLGADSSSWKTSAFFPSYPDYDFRDISAWAWGLSRAVDYLLTDSAVDPSKIMITGVSRLAQAVLVAGAFDERIALSAPVAGGAAFRFSGKEMGGGLGQGITEIVDQNTYWFGPRLPEFRNQTPRLPSDQHWLPALTAPRLFIMCNSLSDQYGRAYAAAQTYLSAKPVYEFLKANDNLGVSFREGTHGMTAEDWSALLDFADQYLLKKGGTRKFDVLPPADKLP